MCFSHNFSLAKTLITAALIASSLLADEVPSRNEHFKQAAVAIRRVHAAFSLCRHSSGRPSAHLSTSADTLPRALTRCGITRWAGFIIYFSDEIKRSGVGCGGGGAARSVTREDHYLSADSERGPTPCRSSITG